MEPAVAETDPADAAAAAAMAACMAASDLTACDSEVTELVPAPEAVRDDIAACAAAAAAKLSLFCRRFTNNELVKLLSLCSNLTLEDIAVEDELLEAGSEAADEALAEADAEAAALLSDFNDDDLRCLSSSSDIIVIDMI